MSSPEPFLQEKFHFSELLARHLQNFMQDLASPVRKYLQDLHISCKMVFTAIRHLVNYIVASLCEMTFLACCYHNYGQVGVGFKDGLEAAISIPFNLIYTIIKIMLNCVLLSLICYNTFSKAKGSGFFIYLSIALLEYIPG